MSRSALSRRMAVWVGFVAFCTVGLAYLPFAYQPLPVIGHFNYYEVLLVGAALLGSGTLLRVAGQRDRSLSRTICRILIAYMAFELLVVVPVAVWLGTAKLTTILDTMSVRFTWLLFPVMLMLCADDRARRIAGGVVVVAAACLVIWGLYSAATGGAGYYLEAGDLRYRVLYGGTTLLFAWPFVLAASQPAADRYTAAFLAISLVGLLLANHRSGFIAFAIAGLVCVLMSGQFRRVVQWVVPIGALAAAVALVWRQQASAAFGYTLSHLMDLSAGTGADRLVRYRLAWDFFASRPINDYVWSWRYYLVYVRDLYQPHSFVFEIAVYEGVAGLLFYGSLLTTTLKHAWKWGTKDAEARALLGYVIVYLAFLAANANWYLPVNFALLVGAVAGLASRVDQLRSAEASAVPEGEVS